MAFSIYIELGHVHYTQVIKEDKGRVMQEEDLRAMHDHKLRAILKLKYISLI